MEAWIRNCDLPYGKENLSPNDMSVYMNKKSGVLGVSGISSDFRDSEEAATDGNKGPN